MEADALPGVAAAEAALEDIDRMLLDASHAIGADFSGPALKAMRQGRCCL